MTDVLTDAALLQRSILGETRSLHPLNKHTNAYAASIVVKSGTGILYGFTVYNSSGSTQFIQVHDAPSLPADGTVPAVFFSVATVTDKAVLWIPGRTFTAGIVICNSSTGPTKTTGSADCWFDAQYI